MDLSSYKDFRDLKKFPKKYSGIYAIYCKSTHKVYIGKSVGIRDRLMAHRSFLKRNTHVNPYLQNTWNKHGEGNFTFIPLLLCERSLLNEYEGLVASLFKDRLLNLAAISGVIEISEELLRKRKGRKLSPSHLENLRRANFSKRKPKVKKVTSEIKIKKAPIPKTIITDDQVYALRADYAQGISPKELQEKYHISRGAVSKILLGKTRNCVPFPINFKMRARSSITKEQVPIIRKMIEEIPNYAEISRMLNLSRSVVENIASKRSWSKY